MKQRHRLEDELVAQGMSFHYVKKIIDDYRDEVIESVLSRVFGTDPMNDEVTAVRDLMKRCKEWVA